MIPTRAYRPAAGAGSTRIDMLLTLFDAAIDRMDRASALLTSEDGEACQMALAQRARAQLLVMGLASGIDLTAGDPTSVDLLRLYEFCARVLASGGREEIVKARDCLATVREGFRAIREEAVRLERSGAIPPAGVRLVEAVG
jgi:flagellin-specific chaperone FliS